MALNIVLICGSYYPNFSATGNCIRQIAGCFVSRGMNVYVISQSPDGKESVDEFEGQKILRVTDKRIRSFVKVRAINQRNPIGKMRVIAIKSYWAIRKLIARSGMDEELSKAFVAKLEQMHDSGIRIDAVLPSLLPVEAVKASDIFCRKHNIAFFPLLYDRYSENRDYFRFTWAQKLKQKHAERFEKQVFDDSRKVFYIDNWGPYFQRIKRDNAIRVEHPLVVKRPEVTPEPLNAPTKINAIYQGEINHQMRPPQAMLTVFEKIAETDPDVSLHVFASGNGVADVQRAAADHPSAIKFYGRVNKGLADQYYASADINIILANRDKEIVSSKIFESVSSGYPIVYFYFSEEEQSYKLLSKYPLVLFIRQDQLDDAACGRIRQWMYDNCGKRVDFQLVHDAYDDATPDMVVDVTIDALSENSGENGRQ